jgi:hypothetical protein
LKNEADQKGSDQEKRAKKKSRKEGSGKKRRSLKIMMQNQEAR